MNSVDTNQPGSKQPTALNGKSPGPADSQYLQTLMAQAQGEAVSSGPPALAVTPTLSGLVRALQRRWMIALGLGLVAAAVAVFSVFQLMPPKYVTSIRLRVIAKQSSAEDVDFPIFKANMESLVKSPLVINSALNQKRSDGREIKDLDLVRGKGVGAVEWLERSLKTDFLLGPEILRVTLAADNAEEAADLLNAVAKAFFDECAETDRSRKQARMTELRTKKERIEEDLRMYRGILYKQMEELKVKDNDASNQERNLLAAKQAGAETSKRAIDDEIAKAESELISLKAKLSNIGSYKVPEEVIEEAFARDRLIEGFYVQMAKLDEAIAGFYAKYYEPHSSRYAVPLKHEKIKLKQLKDQREEMLRPELEKRYRAKVREDMEYQLAVVTEKLQSQKHRRESLAKEIRDLEQKVKDSGSDNRNKPTAVLATEEKIDLARKALDQTALKISEQELEALSSRIVLLDRAHPPTTRDTSRQTKVAGAGGLGIFCMMLFGVAMLEFRSRKISMADDVAHGLGINVVGTIPAMPARSRRPSEKSAQQELLWQNQLHEAVDAIRTVVLHNARKESMRVIMVTSANSGEGKTTLTTQLAASLARAWKRTLVIDGDLRHPATHKLFDVPAEPGFAEVLRGEVEIGDAVRATAFSRLWVLPAGNGDSHAIQALAQDNVGAIFESLKQQYDFILIDTPPVLPVTDTLLLGEHVDGVLLAILRDVSRAPAVHAAQQKLAPLGLHTLGAVVLGSDAEYSDKHGQYASAVSK